jgi:hypothetical protein
MYRNKVHINYIYNYTFKSIFLKGEGFHLRFATANPHFQELAKKNTENIKIMFVYIIFNK